MESSLLDKYIANNNFGKCLGMHFKVIAPGSVDYFITIKEMHLATPLSAHGGLIASLMDAALGVSALSAVQHDKKVVSTVEYKLNFLAPVHLNDELCARARVLQQGKRILVAECDVFCLNKNNKLVAKGMGTFNAYDAIKAGY
jgi:uncharacterized protein (TIGR00369 family)